MATLKADAPFRGLNTLLDASKLEPTEATVAINVNLDKGTLKKRAGFTKVYDLTASDDVVLGIHDFRRDHATETITVDHLIKYGDTLWKSHNGGTPAKLYLGTSGDAFQNDTELASFITHEDIAYFVDNGLDGSSKGYIRAHKDGTLADSVFNAIIHRPESTDAGISYPVLADIGLVAVTGSTMQGQFNYKFTRYSEDWNIESGASDAFPETAHSQAEHIEHESSFRCEPGFGIKIDNIPDTNGGDARVSHIRIYRKNLDGHTLWHKVAQLTLAEAIAVNTATPNGWIDSIADSDLHSADIAPFSLDISFPKALRLIEEHNNQVFACGDNSDLYFSNALTPFSLTDYVVVGGESEAGKITGLVSWKGELIIFKQHSIWKMAGSTQEDFSFQEVVTGTGCFAPHSVISTENALYFLGEDGFYYFDGNAVKLISRAISPDMLGRNYLRDNFVVGVDNKEDRALIWSVSTGTSVVNDTCFVLFYGNSPEAKGPSWAKWQFVNTSDVAMPIQTMARVTLNESTADRLTLYGAGNNKIGKLVDGSKDDTNGDIPFHWRSGKWDGDFPHREKHWQEVYFEQKEQDAGDTVFTVNYLRDNDVADGSKATSIATTMPINFVRLRERSRDIAIEFKAPNTTKVDIIGFSVRSETAGRSH